MTNKKPQINPPEHIQKLIEQAISIIKKRLPENINFRFLWKQNYTEEVNPETIYVKLYTVLKDENYAKIFQHSGTHTQIKFNYNEIKGFLRHLGKTTEIISGLTNQNNEEPILNGIHTAFFLNITLHEIIHFFLTRYNLGEDDDLTREITKYYIQRPKENITREKVINLAEDFNKKVYPDKNNNPPD